MHHFRIRLGELGFVRFPLPQFIEFLPGFLQLLVERFYFEQVVIALLGINGGVKTIAFKKAVQVSQHHFFSLQAGLEIAQLPLKLFDFAVTVGFFIEQSL